MKRSKNSTRDLTVIARLVVIIVVLLIAALGPTLAHVVGGTMLATLTAGTILAVVFLLRAGILPVQWGENRIRQVTIVLLASALSVLIGPELLWSWPLVSSLCDHFGIQFPTANHFWQRFCFFLGFACVLLSLNMIWKRHRS